MKKTIVNLALLGSLALASNIALAGSADSDHSKSENSNCSALPDYTALRNALFDARHNPNNGGFNFDMWGTIVDRDGNVCAVAFTGTALGDQWPGSRLISAQKANTANAFSLPRVALSTANLYSAVQPGGSLFGLQESNPVNTEAAYKGPSKNYGTHNDPLVGNKIGGVNVFGGGLALYDRNKNIIGAIGVSGDTSCTDHNIAWRTRNGLGLDYVPTDIYSASGDPTHPDNIVFDITSATDMMPGLSTGGWGHPKCAFWVDADTTQLPQVQP